MTSPLYEEAPVDFNDLARELVEILRLESDLSYSKCQNFADLVLTVVQERLHLPELSPVTEALRKDIIDIPNSLDTRRMRKCLEIVSEFCADSQQRSWTLFEDEAAILTNLKTLSSLLNNADKRVSLYVLSEDDYSLLRDVVRFYQMETRLSIRIILLEILRRTCFLSPNVISVLLTTVLPSELAQEITAESQMTKKSPKFSSSLELMTLLLVTGEQIPFPCYDALHEDFLRTVLNIVETQEDDDGTSSCHAMNLLLGFNLHHVGSEMISSVIKNAECTKKFAEHLLLLANRKEDPVWPYKNLDSPYVSSVLNMLANVLNDSSTLKIFYANDLLVLVDIVLREIRDLSPGKRRTKFLEILQLLAKNPHLLDSRLNEIKNVLRHFDIDSSSDNHVDGDELLLENINKLLK